MASSLFCSHICNTIGDSSILSAGFCSTEPILAVSTNNKELFLFDSQGGDPLAESIVGKSNALLLAWKPNSKSFAVGWEDGQISFWSFSEDATPSRQNESSFHSPVCVSSNDGIHKKECTFLLWSDSGHRLISGDIDGLCCVWKFDSQGSILPIVQYQKTSSLTTAIFCSSSITVEQTNLTQTTTRFCFGTEGGVISLADDLGKCVDVQKIPSRVDKILFYIAKKRIVAITRSRTLIQLELKEDGSISSMMKAKLGVLGDGGDSGILDATWVAPGVIVCATGENILRFWDLNSSENYVLSVSSVGLDRSERIISVAFNFRQRYLAAGTRGGKCVMWKYNNIDVSDNSHQERRESRVASDKMRWKGLSMSTSHLQGAIDSLIWGPGYGNLAARTACDIHTINEEVLQHVTNDGMVAMQVNNSSLVIEKISNGSSINIDTGMTLKCFALDSHHLVACNGKEIRVYKLLEELSFEQLSDFPSWARSVAVYQDTLFIAQNNNLLLTTFEGVQKLSIPFADNEGFPILLDTTSHFLTFATNLGTLKLMSVSKKEPQLLGTGKFVDQKTQKPLGIIRSIKCNCDGKFISIISDKSFESTETREPDSRLYIYDVYRDVIESAELGDERRVPVSHYWDPDEPKLLSCSTQLTYFHELSPSNVTDESKQSDECGNKNCRKSPNEVVTIFVSPDSGVHVHDIIPIDNSLKSFVGIHTPHFLFAQYNNMNNSSSSSSSSSSSRRSESGNTTLVKQTMSDFIGLEDGDEAMKSALMAFSYNLTIGNTDEAYRSVRLIENPFVWESIAHMCVKTNRLDVSEICLSNMGHARGAEAVRLAKLEPEKEVAIAAVAIQLGLLDDAARIYKSCNRFDLLNKLYQGRGMWKEAIAVAEENDRIHLKTTHFQHAKYLESVGDVAGAIQSYEMAGTHRSEAIRIFLDSNQVEDLEEYILQKKDMKLVKWLAAYCESVGDFEKSRKYYSRADDVLSVVRLACHDEDYDTAYAVVDQSGSAAAAHYLARQLEGMGEVKKAIELYAKSGVYNHAIRLSKLHGFDSELMSLALKSKPPLMIGCAQYFEEKGEAEKAVQLYVKGGENAKALSLCLRVGEETRTRPDMVEIFLTVTDNLAEDTADSDIELCTKILMQCGEHKKAVELLYKKGKRFEYALDLCVEHNITVTDDLAEGLSPPKSNNNEENARRVHILKRLGKVCKHQGNFHLACKKYTQAGDRVSAIKCLLKSGDTKKIISYASVSKNRDAYILAANYLQNLDWHNEPDIMKAIVQLYSKGGAFEQLVRFFNACAQIEIDEFRDYEKALGALTEAAKYVTKMKNEESHDLVIELRRRIHLVERFVEARNAMKSDPAVLEKTCVELLSRKDTESVIRAGDIYSLLVEYYHSLGRFDAALELVKRMRQREIVVENYIDSEILEEVGATASGAPLHTPSGASTGHEDELDDESDGSAVESISDEDINSS